MGYRVDYTSLKNLWQAVANCRREQREEERRHESRLPAHGIACIYWEVEGGSWRSEKVSLLGISKHGCSFRSGEPLALDQKILIEGGTTLGAIEAVVRHSEPDGHEYIIGTKILCRDGKPLEPDQPDNRGKGPQRPRENLNTPLRSVPHHHAQPIRKVGRFRLRYSSRTRARSAG
jgi:hypothetical protein